MLIKEEERALGPIYAEYEKLRTKEKLTALPVALALGTEGALFTATWVASMTGHTKELTELLNPSILSFFTVGWLTAVLPIFWNISYGNETSKLAVAIADLEGISLENWRDVWREKRLNNKTIQLAGVISPSINPLQILTQPVLELNFKEMANMEHKQDSIFAKFDAKSKRLSSDPPTRSRKTAGALELARFKWQEVLEQDSFLPPFRERYAEEMIGRIGRKRFTLPSSFTP